MVESTRDSRDFSVPSTPAGPSATWVWARREPSNPLAQLHGRPLGQHTIQVLLGPTSRFGARYFRVLLVDGNGSLSREPVLAGLRGSGPLPSYNWVEVAESRRSVRLEGEGTASIGERGLRELLCMLSEIVPPGGHLMVEYDSGERTTTARGLARGVPPLATPLGAALLAAGCGPGIRDWHISEGGREGPRKLQGHKPLSETDAQKRAQRVADELRAFLESPRAAAEDALLRAARRRARIVLRRLPPSGIQPAG